MAGQVGLHAVRAILDVEPRHGALHGAEGLVSVRARVITVTAVVLDFVTDEGVTGGGSVGQLLSDDGGRSGRGVALLLVIRRRRQAFSSVSERPQLVGHRQL